MAIRIDLNKPLVSKLLVNGKVQVVEYESLPTICFNCGKYDHVSDTCPKKTPDPGHGNSVTPEPVQPHDSSSSAYEPWMQVDKRQRRPVRKLQAKELKRNDMEFVGSHFNPIYEDDEDVHVIEGVTLNDFPIVTRSGSKVSSSRNALSLLKTTHLDKSRRLAIVLPENLDPNPCLVAGNPGDPSVSDNTFILGDLPDTHTKLSPNSVAYELRQYQASLVTKVVEPVEAHEADMLE
ncbi:hypothetical protein V6N13_043213 [Hibiscus sabdariffa]